MGSSDAAEVKIKLNPHPPLVFLLIWTDLPDSIRVRQIILVFTKNCILQIDEYSFLQEI